MMLLFELGETTEALEILREFNQEEDSIVDQLETAHILVGGNRIEDARTACENARESHWNPLEVAKEFFGFDQKAGGIYSKGFFNKPAHKRRKIWWVQAEGLVSALHLYQLMKRERYWKCFTLTLEWIFTHQVDWNHGDWYEQIEPEGYPTGGKSGNWKSPYHNGRAMLQCSEILNQLTEK